MIELKDIVKVLVLLIPVIGSILTYILLPVLKSKIGKKKFNELLYWGKFAVKAVEQIYSDRGMGKLKKENVIKYLKNKGLNVAEEDYNIIVEALVRELNREKEIEEDVVEKIQSKTDDELAKDVENILTELGF